MKLGLSAETYRWVAFPWMCADRADFRAAGRLIPYFASITPPAAGESPLDWFIERARAHGLASLALDSGWFGTEAHAQAFRARMAAAGLTYLASVSVELAATPEAWGTPATARSRRRPQFDPALATSLRTGWTGGSQAAIAVRALELAAAAGAEVVSLVHGQPDRPNHFTKDPPLAQQLDRMVRNLRTLAPIAEGMGLVLATEGHMDYRCAEYAQVLEGVNSPWVRHVFDFADSIAVNEDPLEAVQRVAKYTVASHLKDMRVQPITEIATGAFFHTPIGQGSVPVERMLEILAAQAPNPGGLHHYLEVTPPPEIDVERWLGASVEWLRTHCARFWSRGGQSNAPTKQGSAP